MASYVFWSVDLCRLAEKLKFLVTCQVSPDRKIAIQIISNALIVAHSTGQSNPYWIHSVKGTLVTEQFIFTMVFIVLRIPVGISGFLYRIPPGGLVSLSVLNAVRRWRKFWVFVHIVQIALNPLIVFVLSTEIRQYLRSCFELNILP